MKHLSRVALLLLPALMSIVIGTLCEFDLHYGSESGNLDMVKSALRDGVDINSADETGWTALMLAINYDKMPIVSYLLSRHTVDINAKAVSNGQTVLMIAATKGSLSVVNLLMNHRKIETMKGGKWRWIAARLVGQLCLNVNDQTNTGETALMRAASEGHSVIVKRLLEHPEIEVNAVTSDGLTALIMGAVKGHTVIVNYLLIHPAMDYNMRDRRDQWTALMHASSKGHHSIMELLLRQPRIDLNAKALDGMTALMIAASNRDVEAVSLLIAHSAIDVTPVDKEGRTAMMIADGRDDIVAVINRRVKATASDEAFSFVF